ncbi:MAG TPA: KH domain-containing protein [Chlamydiales bacterium]|nr:KH domain-containing protein [Chlamydiales bacterium]
MEQFIAYLVKNIVAQPDAVDIRSMMGQSGLLIEIRVAPEDIGKVVGRKGNVIRSLRTLAMTIGARLGRRVHLEIIQQ